MKTGKNFAGPSRGLFPNAGSGPFGVAQVFLMLAQTKVHTVIHIQSVFLRTSSPFETKTLPLTNHSAGQGHLRPSLALGRLVFS